MLPPPPPAFKDRVILLHHCPFVCMSAQILGENSIFSSYSETYSITRLIFGMKADLIDTHCGTKVKVIYQGQGQILRSHFSKALSENLTFSCHSYNNIVTRHIFGMKASVIGIYLVVPMSRFFAKVRIKY